MKFCSKCGTYLTTIELNGKKTLSCPRCNTEAEPETVIRIIDKRTEAIVTIGHEEATVNPLPKTSAICEKCGNMEAYYWQVQTRGGDEPMTRFYRCTSCGTTWREYD